MGVFNRLANLPARVAAGAFMLNAGLGKISPTDEAATAVHGMATTAYPFLGQVPPASFTKALGASEIGLGTALLLPIVPDGVAGAALTAFSAGLIGLYLRVPGMRNEGSLRPTQQGTAISKDIWLLALGVSLMTHARSHRTRGRQAAPAD
jgi:hypothetical protein